MIKGYISEKVSLNFLLMNGFISQGRNLLLLSLTSFGPVYLDGDLNTKTNSAKYIIKFKALLESESTKLVHDVGKILEIKRHLRRAYYQEELFWKQKCHFQWIREGDRNTQFYYGCVKVLATEEINSILTYEITNDEIKKDAMGPDGMTYAFFHQYWDVIENAIITEVKELFSSSQMPISTQQNTYMFDPQD